MRQAVRRAFFELTGHDPETLSSGWGRAASHDTLAPAGMDELRALSTAATPGPWRASIGRVGVGALSAERRSLLLASIHADGHRDTAFAESHNDAAFIVAAVNYVRARLTAESGEPGS